MRFAGLLVTLLLLGGLAVFVLNQMADTNERVSEDAGVGSRLLPGGLVDSPGVDSGPGVVAQSPIDAAATAACASEAQIIRQAEELYHVLNGRYADGATLAADGNLREPPTYYDIVVSPDGATFELAPRAPCG